MRIYIWPCGTWAYEDELEEMGYMSDDFFVVDIPTIINMTEDEIEQIVQYSLDSRS